MSTEGLKELLAISETPVVATFECPLAYAPPPEWEPLGAGDVLEPGRLYRVPGIPESEFRAEAEIVVSMPIERRKPNPPQGVKHVADFVALPKGYATERWNGNREEEPYVQCTVCGATFPRRAFPNLIA